MNHRRLLELFWDFSRFIESLHTLYLDSVAGYSILHERLLNKQQSMKDILGEHEYATEEFQDTYSIQYKNICDKDFTPVSTSPVIKQGDLKERTKHNGENSLFLGSQCVVSAYTYWEEYLRIEIGKAMGVLKQDAENTEGTRNILNTHVANDFWGDMKYLRHSIVHKNGMAVSGISRCKIIKWFSPGEKIELDYEKMRSIFLALGKYRNEIHSMSLPKSSSIKITNDKAC